MDYLALDRDILLKRLQLRRQHSDPQTKPKHLAGWRIAMEIVTHQHFYLQANILQAQCRNFVSRGHQQHSVEVSDTHQQLFLRPLL